MRACSVLWCSPWAWIILDRLWVPNSCTAVWWWEFVSWWKDFVMVHAQLVWKCFVAYAWVFTEPRKILYKSIHYCDWGTIVEGRRWKIIVINRHIKCRIWNWFQGVVRKVIQWISITTQKPAYSPVSHLASSCHVYLNSPQKSLWNFSAWLWHHFGLFQIIWVHPYCGTLLFKSFKFYSKAILSSYLHM